MKSFYIFSPLLLIFLFYCQDKKNRINEKNKQVFVKSENYTRPINDLKSLVLFNGDSVAYDELETAYLGIQFNQEYLLYSLIMANKYNNKRAYFNVYNCLTSSFEKFQNKIDDKTKTIAIDYLKKGAGLHDPQCVIELSKLYLEGKYIKKDIVLGKKLEKEGTKLGVFNIW